MKVTLFAAAAAALVTLAGAASAEPYVDYTAQKGAWEVQSIKVDPNHIDDYLVGLKSSWVPGEKLAQQHGVIDQYMIMVKLNASDGGANVLLCQHYPSLSMLEPDKARDQALEKEGLAVMSKEKGQALVAGFEKYRSFVGDDIYVPVDMAK